jgi:hypothetical protein
MSRPVDFSLLRASGRAHGNPLMPRGNYPQSMQYFRLLGGTSSLDDAQCVQAEMPLNLLIFGQDFVNELWIHSLFEDVTLVTSAPGTVVLPRPDHWTPGVTLNNLTSHTYLTGTNGQFNFGRGEAFRGVTSSNVPVVGYLVQVNQVDRVYEAGAAHFEVDGWFSCHAPIMVGAPTEIGAVTHGSEAAITGIYPAIIPVNAYTAAIKANNNVTTDHAGVEVYVVGLYQIHA